MMTVEMMFQEHGSGMMVLAVPREPQSVSLHWYADFASRSDACVQLQAVGLLSVDGAEKLLASEKESAWNVAYVQSPKALSRWMYSFPVPKWVH